MFICRGGSIEQKDSLEGSDLQDVLWGVDFLVKVREGKLYAVKENVLVIGGGNVAIDVVLSALRLVSLACLEKREEMPANPWEMDMAIEEGVEMLCSWGPYCIMDNADKITGVEIIRCKSVFNDAGNFCPFFDETKKQLLPTRSFWPSARPLKPSFARIFACWRTRRACKCKTD